jgi:hypothetical protein
MAHAMADAADAGTIGRVSDNTERLHDLSKRIASAKEFL